ncbi:hypothetical protein [Kitasatospora aureofaciens]|uniref:hypothetical protein n=1 Tax=Kitasatospora aureofaciens TaxID=1894 RepID=UPI001C484B01|nr:hypothetical protein [Kitasatospora aureofaciens]MBV6703338.1 hypothetical protein [Kitasatospora aureofaciens]
MSLREIAQRTPGERHPDADQCPTCAYFADAEERYPADDYPTIGRHLSRARKRHLDDGECLAVPDDE